MQALRFCNSCIFDFWFAIFPSINTSITIIDILAKDLISRLRSNTITFNASLAHLSMEKQNALEFENPIKPYFNAASFDHKKGAFNSKSFCFYYQFRTFE